MSRGRDKRNQSLLESWSSNIRLERCPLFGKKQQKKLEQREDFTNLKHPKLGHHPWTKSRRLSFPLHNVTHQSGPPSLELVFVKRYFNNQVDAECLHVLFSKAILLTGTLFTNGVEICEMATVGVKSVIWGRVINRRILFVPAYDPWQGSSQHCVWSLKGIYFLECNQMGLKNQVCRNGAMAGSNVFVLSSDFRTKANTAKDMDESTSSPQKSSHITESPESWETIQTLRELSFEKVYTWYITLMSNPFFGVGRVWYFQDQTGQTQKTASYKSIKKAQHR